MNPYFTTCRSVFYERGSIFHICGSLFYTTDPYISVYVWILILHVWILILHVRMRILVCGSLFYMCRSVFYVFGFVFYTRGSVFYNVDLNLHVRIRVLHVWVVFYTVDPYFILWIPIYHAWMRILHCGSVPSLTQLVADLSLRQPGFKLRSVHLGCMMETVVLAQVYSEYSSLPCQCHSINALYSFVHLSLTLYDINNSKRR